MGAGFISTVSEAELKRERARARALRQSNWWKGQLGQGLCYYCHSRLHPSELTMDHKTPVVRGGRSVKSNLVPCCKTCNNEKKHATMEEWVASRHREGRPLACSELDLR